MTRLECDKLTITVPGRELVRELTLELKPGNFVAVLGTNGVGKTLTLQTLAGLRPTTADIRISGDALGSLPRKSLAQRLGMLLQIQEDAFPLTVIEAVLMGRYPHMNLWQWPDSDDEQQARDALECFDLRGLEDRSLESLSGGERERVALATLYTQNPDIWLLDEPMNHLDPQHQLQVMRRLRDIAAAGRIVVASLHNPALAMRFADCALILYGNGEWEFGSSAELLEPGRLERAYGTTFEYFSNNDARVLLPV
jgi:iron complex transport system ATP-binding protein